MAIRRGKNLLVIAVLPFEYDVERHTVVGVNKCCLNENPKQLLEMQDLEMTFRPEGYFNDAGHIGGVQCRCCATLILEVPYTLSSGLSQVDVHYLESMLNPVRWQTMAPDDRMKSSTRLKVISQADRREAQSGVYCDSRLVLPIEFLWSLLKCVLVPMVLFLSSLATAQDRDSTRVSIHQSETEMHRWDRMKVHASVPQLRRGVEMARQGDMTGAIRAFQKAAPARPSMAYFNMGIVYFETGRLEQALRYFRLSYRARKDSLCLDNLRNTERLLKEHKQPR
jgi:hypothetical protein